MSRPGKRCPKCKVGPENVLIRELWRNHSIVFDQDEAGKIDREGYLSEGSPYALQGECGVCQHRWKIRGSQISNLPGCPS